MKHQSMCLSIATFIFCFASLSANATLPDLAPPKVQLVDEFGVNVHSGQVQSSLDTVSIGGAMGLSHSISNYTNNFSIAGYRGYQDKFYTKGRITEIETRIGRPFKNVLRVHDIGGSADFELIVGGVPVNFTACNNVSTFTYRALGDGRNILEWGTDGVYWTKPDGTVVKFEKGSAGCPGQVNLLRQIKYPNGFTIDVDNLNRRVTTNTGFALKYIHRDTTTPADWAIDPSKIGLAPLAEIPAINPQLWLNGNPVSVQAINLAKENCLTSTCAMNWPKAEFTWPTAMPRSLYIGDSTFKVTDAMGGVTEYYFRAFDLIYKEDIAGNPIAVNPNYIGRNFSPRLIGIKPAGATEKVFQYTYKNIFQDNYANTNADGVGSVWFTLSSEAGQVKTATRYDEIASYSIGDAYYDDIQNMGGGYVTRVLPKFDAYPGAINQVTTKDGTINYEYSFRNFPTHYIKSSGVEEYEYDARGNMKKVTKNGTWTSALYPVDCISTHRKYCNKPIWTSDAKGNKTEFTYHYPIAGEEPSGEVRTITYPADKNGLVKVIRYEYTQHRAKYYTPNGTLIDGTPIWLKTAERTCATSNTIGDSCAAANDEIVTRYKYESDNLYLTGMTVEAYDGTLQQPTIKRTCYEYDKYGNKIGESQPKANPPSCSRQ